MKKIGLAMVTVALLLLTVPAYAGNPVKSSSDIVGNLVVGLTSENYGLRVSSAYVLGDLIDRNLVTPKEASDAMIPLLKILHDEETEDARIVAALALYKIGHGIGVYNLGDAAIQDESERVRKICENLYCDFHIKNGSAYFCQYLHY